jgi:uncharacterized protein Veg
MSKIDFGILLHLATSVILPKTIERSGVLKETYPSVFVVELDQDKHNFERVSYTPLALSTIRFPK